MTAAMPVAPVPAAPRPSPSSAAALPPQAVLPSLLPKDVRREVQKEIKNLESGDQVVAIKAAAALVMLARLPDATPFLPAAITRLIPFLHDSTLSVHLQRNACAALTAIMTCDPSLYLAAAKAPTLALGLVRCLEGEPESQVDSGLQLNAAAALSVLAQQEEGLGPIQDAEADSAIISALTSAKDAQVKEEVVDALCALSSHEIMRSRIVQKGAVSQLACVVQDASAEVCVRTLLALGMLCGSSSEAQVELAGVDGAVDTLLALMKSSDHDIKSISQDLFRALTLNQKVRPLLEHHFRHLLPE
ncbi:unnamed protein product [Sphagnum balticum]